MLAVNMLLLILSLFLLCFAFVDFCEGVVGKSRKAASKESF